MNEESLKAIESKKYLDDQVVFSQVQQLAFGADSASTLIPCANTSYSTTSSRFTNVSARQQLCIKEVDDASLFMDNKLKILAASPYAKQSSNMHKLDDMSHISSSYAITEYFNVMYYDKLLTPGSKCNYAINDTKNVARHLSFFTQTLENIVQHKSAFTIEKIVHKWEKLHKALI